MNMAVAATEGLFDGADVIHSYTRAQALDDGILVDVTEMAREAGFRFPVAMSINAWSDCVEWCEEDSKRQVYQDQSGRLWDVLWMASCAARQSATRNRSMAEFSLYRVPRGGRGMRPRLTRLKLAIGPGDGGEPVITILLPGED